MTPILSSLRLAAVLVLAAITRGTHGEQPTFELQISKDQEIELSWPSETGASYTVQYTTNLAEPLWNTLAADIQGTGAILSIKDQDSSQARRYYRGSKTEATGSGEISPSAILPDPGVVYPAQTIFGSPFLGLQYTIPNAWKGGLRTGSSTMLFASDTEPGLVIGFLTLAGNAQTIAALLGQDFQSPDGYYQLVAPAEIANGRITVEWQLLGQDVRLRVVGIVHPSGGIIGFAGLFAEANRAVTERVLNEFAASTIAAARPTRDDLVQLIAGKSFAWAKSTSTGGGTSGSLISWSENNAFFCPGTYEITTRSESSFSGNLSGGGFYSGGSSSNSTEAGDWTIVDTPAGPGMILISASGIQSALIQISGNTVYFGDQEFSYQGTHACP